MTILEPLPETAGPLYPRQLGATVDKFRRIETPTDDQRRAHGQAVGAAIRALLKRERDKDLVPLPPIYTGTDRERAAKFRAESRARAIRALRHNLPVRTEAQWLAAYASAMKAKRIGLTIGPEAFAGIPPPGTVSRAKRKPVAAPPITAKAAPKRRAKPVKPAKPHLNNRPNPTYVPTWRGPDAIQLKRAKAGKLPRAPKIPPSHMARAGKLYKTLKRAARQRDLKQLRGIAFNVRLDQSTPKKLERFRQLAIIAIRAEMRAAR